MRRGEEEGQGVLGDGEKSGGVRGVVVGGGRGVKGGMRGCVGSGPNGRVYSLLL